MSYIAFLTAITLSLYVKTPVPQTLQNPPAGANVWRFNCSVVMVGPDEALTASHCVSKGDKLYKVKSYDNQFYGVKIEAWDAEKDLALLKLSKRQPVYAKIRGNEVKRGDRVGMVSSEDEMPGTYGEGMVQNIVLDPTTDCPQIVHNIPILGGASGSGLFDTTGKLIGINVQAQRGTSYATDTLQIRHFLEEYHQHKHLEH